jgi:hypothetical protein
MNQFVNGLFRGLASHAGQALASVVITGVLGALGIDNNADSQADCQTDSQADTDSTDETTNA